MNKLSNSTYNQNQLDLSGLVLLAAFPKPSGDLYMWCGALMEPMVSLGMAVCGCTALLCGISTSAVNFLSF